MPLPTNAQLGRYEIRSQLGAGGMGEVYLAYDAKFGRTVALKKILPPEVASDQQRMQRFNQEARAVSALNHPNIITIHEIEESASTHFIATDFKSGTIFWFAWSPDGKQLALARGRRVGDAVMFGNLK